MFSNIVLINSIKFRLISNQFIFKRYLISSDNQLIDYRFNYQKYRVLSFRYFCDKNTPNNSLEKIKPKSIENQIQNPNEIIAKQMSKTSEFVYIILKKPKELMEWIANTPPEKKKNVIFSAIIKHLIKPLGVISLLILVYCFSHSDQNPITGRSCVYSLPQQMAEDIENDIFNEIFNECINSGKFLPSTNPLVKRLDIVFERLVNSNNDLELIGDGIWTPVVINDDQISDILILRESRNVFVYKKIMDLCQNDDELAYVLAHQLSHVMLDHRKEPIAHSNPIFAPFLALFPQLWALGRDPVLKFDIFSKIDDFVENIFKFYVRKVLEFSPYTPELEEEADRIAMQLMTRSCYDITKCREFCKRHKKDHQINEEKNDFFEKHPISEQKLLYLFQYIKPFIELRKVCNCQPIV